MLARRHRARSFALPTISTAMWSSSIPASASRFRRTTEVDPNELLKNADMALYGAKTDGRGTYRFFEPEMDARMKARRTLELALRGALERGEFELNYQPLLHLGENRVELLRGTACDGGIPSAVWFLPRSSFRSRRKPA